MNLEVQRDCSDVKNRICILVAEDWSWVPSTHLRLLTTTCNTSFFIVSLDYHCLCLFFLLLLNSSFSYVCIVDMCICMRLACLSMSTGPLYTCMWRFKLSVRNDHQCSFTITQVKVSESNPELTDMAPCISQHALGLLTTPIECFHKF